MSGAVDGEQVYLAQVVRTADGRLREIRVIPDPPPGSDKEYVLVSAGAGDAEWKLPEDAGFSAVPMLMDVPLADMDGFLLEDDFGVLVNNVPYI